MAVTSTTITANGVTYNVYRFSGVVTDADLINSPPTGTAFTGAWANTVDSETGTMSIDRAIYIDDTADLRGIRGNYNIYTHNLATLGGVNNQVLGFILHSGRNRANTALRNFNIIQPGGNVVNARGWYVAGWNGQATSALTELGQGIATDGLDLNGSSYLFSTPKGGTGGSDRILCEIGLGNLTNAVIGAQRYTVANVQPCIGSSSIIRGVTFNKCAGFPQSQPATATVNQVIYRSTLDNNGTQTALRPYNRTNQCFVDSTFTYNGGSTGNIPIIDGYPSNPGYSRNIVVMNAWQDQNWFGTTLTAIKASAWTTTNQ